MARREGEVTPTTAARMLDLNPETLRRWLRGETKTKLPEGSVRRDVAGRYYIRRVEVQRLLQETGPATNHHSYHKCDSAPGASCGPP